MTETRDRTDPLDREAFVEGLLATATGPAIVCDPDGRIRAWTDGFEELPVSDGLAGTAVESVLECGESGPWNVALDDAAAATARGRLAADGRAVRVECRPVTVEGAAVGALVTLAFDGSAGDRVVGDGDASGDRAIGDGDRADEGPDSVEWPVYEAAVHAAPDHVYAVDADGRILLMSREFERATGVPTDELIGESPAELAEYDYVSEADVDRGCEALEAVLAGERERATVTTRPRVEGVEVVAENSIAPIRRDGEIVGAVVVVRDVTDRARQRERLRESRERLDLALESTDAGVFEWDLCSDRTYWHPTTSELFGLDPDTTERPASAFQDRLHPEDRERVLAAVEATIESGGDLSVEYRIRRPDGEVRWMVTDGRVVFEDGQPDRLVGAVHDITERKERERQLKARKEKLRAVIQSSPDPIFVKDVDCRYRIVNDAALEMIDRPREAVVGETPEAVFGERIGAVIRERTERVLETEEPHAFEEQAMLAGSEYALATVRTPYYGPDGDVEGAVTVTRDLTEQRSQREELETLARIQQLIQETIGALASATTRETITRTVCDRLADSEFYELAWVGERDPSSREVELNYAAGASGDALADGTVAVDTSEHDRGPAGRAYRTGEVQIVEDVRAAPSFAPWREVALEHGYQSVAAIPLTHGSITHGILAVYADRPDAFSERERAGFEVLGEAVGFALGAAQNRRLIESEGLLELEFELSSPDATLTALSGERDCRFVVEYTVRSGDDGIIYYVDVEGIDPETVRERLSQSDSVETVRLLDGGSDRPDLELVVADSVYRRIADAGAYGQRSVIEDGVRRIVVEAPTDVNVRRVISVLEADFEEVELVAKREKDRSDASLWPAGGDLGGSLTDRQQSVLRTAYYSGYYEWPRETDSEALADSLDIASTTLLQHLRKGHKRILSAMFDQDRP